KVLVVPGGGSMSRKQIDELEGVARTYGAKGLAWCKIGESGLEGGISKFIGGKEADIRALGANTGDLVLFVADRWKVATTALGAVRSRLGYDLGLIDPDRFAFAWIVDFPLFEWDDENGKWEPAHHMFTMPREEYIDTMEDDPGAVKGDLYDLVCNGYELASGSIRIHNPDIQQRVFDIVGFSREEAMRRFGFLMDAFRYGAPPHGGIAPGLDRLLMILTGEHSIREVIAFPKTTAGVSPMDDSPSEVDQEQLDELGLRIVEDAAEANEQNQGEQKQAGRNQTGSSQVGSKQTRKDT
ncbi:MAG: amino acid--tRNA ligase-related protein, partial [Spirochaetia bacterium]